MVAGHERVRHTESEHIRGDIRSSLVESHFSISGMKGVYQHCKEKHLLRHLAEFDFRHNQCVRLAIKDAERVERAILGLVGKRLTYRTARGR